MAGRSGSIQYSAEAAGTTGQLHCHVIRRRFGNDGHAHYSITVGNETDDEASVFAFAVRPLDPNRHTVVRTTIGARSKFSASATFEPPQADVTPELYVVLSSGDIEFTLVVPGGVDVTGRGPRDRSTTITALPSGIGLQPLLPAIHEPRAKLASAPASGRHLQEVASLPRRFSAVPVRARKSPAVVPMLLFFAAFLAAAAFMLLRPQIGDLVVPQGVAPGQSAMVRYRATGVGAAAYTLLSPDGASIAHGALELGAGSFLLTLPPAPAAQAYLVRVRVEGAFGAAVAEDYLRVTSPTVVSGSRAAPKRSARRPSRSPRDLGPPQIRSLALDRSTLASGETLGVYYDVLATNGTIVLTDPAAQITYGRAVFTASGRASFVAPHVDAPRLLSVIVTARRGTSTTQSRTTVTVTAADDSAQAMPNRTDSGSVNDSVATSVAKISVPASVRSRQPIRVDVRGAGAGLAIVLQDEAGAEIARRAVASGRPNIIEFTAPTVHAPTRFILTATYPNGQGSEMIVRSVTVVP